MCIFGTFESDKVDVHIKTHEEREVTRERGRGRENFNFLLHINMNCLRVKLKIITMYSVVIKYF